MEIYKIRTSLTEKGLKTFAKPITVTEAKLTYITEENRQIKKNSILVVETNLHNNLNSAIIMFYTYCLKDDMQKAKELTSKAVVDRYKELKDRLDKLTNGLYI